MLTFSLVGEKKSIRDSDLYKKKVMNINTLTSWKYTKTQEWSFVGFSPLPLGHLPDGNANLFSAIISRDTTFINGYPPEGDNS